VYYLYYIFIDHWFIISLNTSISMALLFNVWHLFWCTYLPQGTFSSKLVYLALFTVLPQWIMLSTLVNTCFFVAVKVVWVKKNTTRNLTGITELFDLSGYYPLYVIQRIGTALSFALFNTS
jgi:hypothetical protein